mgnify:CR=1 FL=1
MKAEFIKCHGSGNDFVMVDATSVTPLTDGELSLFSRSACDRNGQLGADGVLFVFPSHRADARMRIFNADGSEAEMCGNGIRCTARLVAEKTGRDAVLIETAKAILECRREDELSEGVASYSVLINNISPVSADFPYANGQIFLNSPIPALSETALFTFVSLGNPHIVSFRNDKINSPELLKTGLQANMDKGLFPNGVNVTFFNLTGDQAIYTETFERGVGLTCACGTAMSACSIAACLGDLCEAEKWISIRNKGGMVKCIVSDISGDMNVRLWGNATFEYSGRLEFTGGKLKIYPEKNMHANEIGAYGRFLQKMPAAW